MSTKKHATNLHHWVSLASTFPCDSLPLIPDQKVAIETVIYLLRKSVPKITNNISFKLLKLNDFCRALEFNEGMAYYNKRIIDKGNISKHKWNPNLKKKDDE